MRITGHIEGSAAGRDGTLDVEYSPYGSQLATADADNLTKAWDAESGEELLILAGHVTGLISLAHSPDSRSIAAYSNSGESSEFGEDATVILWDAHTGEELINMADQAFVIGTVAFTPDGQRSVTGGVDSASVWDIETGIELVNLDPDDSWRAALTQDGRRLYAADYQRPTVRVFAAQLEDAVALAPSRLTRPLTTDEYLQYLHMAECPARP